MRTNRTLSIAAALGAVLCLEASAGKVIPEYANEFETEWFDAGISNLSEGAPLPSSSWTKPASTDAEVTVGTGKITLDTDLDDPLTYKPAGACSDVAVVSATMTATVNASEPTFTTAPQAALAVFGTSTSTNWAGLVGKDGGGTEWVAFPSPVPVAGQVYSVRIEFDQRSSGRKIRYLVGGEVLADGTNTDGWYPNPSAANEDISKVSFSGSGDITALSGNNVLDASFDMAEAAGFDFTNGVVKVSNVDVGGVAATAKIKVIDCKTGAEVGAYAEQTISGSTPVSWDLAAGLTDHALVPGGDYTYEVDILVDGEVVAKKTDTFLAANWTDDTWFGADASKTEGSREIGGEWDLTKKPEGIENNAYVIDDDALFNVLVATQDEGTNKVTRVDAEVMFDAFVTNLTTPEDDAFGGFVAAKTSDAPAQWMALTAGGWKALTGAAAPALNTAYTVRAEVDFLSKDRRVRYFVKAGSGDFVPLAYGDSDWIQLVGDANTFTSVEFQGSGTLAKFEATIADKALAEVNGKKYDSMEKALEEAGTTGENPITLLTNATVDPTKAGFYEINPNAHSYVAGGEISDKARTITFDKDGNVVVRPNNQVMAEVAAPSGKPYKDPNSLRIFLELNNVPAYKNENATHGDIETALNAQGANGLPLWEDYVMGIEPEDSVTPEYTPSADTDKVNFSLQVPALGEAIKDHKPSGDYAIKYKINQNVSVTMPDTGIIPVALPAAATDYNVSIVLEPIE